MRKDGRIVMKRPHLIENGTGAILFGGSVDEFQYMSHRWTDAERLLDIHILELMGVRETVKWIRPQAHLTFDLGLRQHGGSFSANKMLQFMQFLL